MCGITHKANIIFLYQIKSKVPHPPDAYSVIARRATQGPPSPPTAQTVILRQSHILRPITTVPGQPLRPSNDAPTAPIALTVLIIPITPRRASTAPTRAPQMPSSPPSLPLAHAVILRQSHSVRPVTPCGNPMTP